MDPTPGPSSQPMDVDDPSDTPPGDGDATPQSPPTTAGSSTADKGKGKEVDWDSVRLVELPSGPIAGLASPPSSGFPALTPRPAPFRQSPTIQLDHIPTRRRPLTPTNSSDIDTISSTLLPMGVPLPSPTPTPTPTPTLPPAKKFRPLGPTPLPPGRPTVQHLRILLESEHVDMNRPKQFFDLLRKHGNEPPKVQLSPAEIKEILEKMRRVNEIWLRTMGEDEGSVSVIAGWLAEFIGNKNPKLYEGVVSPAIWVILKAKPPIKVLRSSRFATLAQQCLEKAKTRNLSKKDDIEKAVHNLDQLMQLAKKNATSSSSTNENGNGNATPSGSGSGAGPVPGSNTSAASTIPKRTLPTFKKTNSSSTLPLGDPASSTSAAPSASLPPPAKPFESGPNGAGHTRPPPVIPQNNLAALLASVMPVVKALPTQRPNATAGPSQRPPPEVKPKVEPGPSSSNGPSYRPPTSGGPSSAFRPAPGPVPMVVKREPGLPPPIPTSYAPRANVAGPSSAPLSTSGSGSASEPSRVNPAGISPAPLSASSSGSGFGSASGPSTPTASYPSNNNRWSSVATPTGASRPFDGKKLPNWRNHTIRYRDNALAEARLFEQDEYEEEFDPYWWKYGKHGDNHTIGELDREEGHTMRHLHGHEPAIEWYDPSVYDLQHTTVGPVITPECQVQEQRERPILSAYYRENSDIPPCPEESNVRYIQEGYGTLYIPPMPRAIIPRPQPRPQQPMYNQPPPPQSPQFPYGDAFRPRDVPPNNAPTHSATSPSFRPRNPTPTPGMSPAYRPRDRASSNPAPPTQDPATLPRRASTPGPATAPKPKNTLPPSGNVEPQLDREGTIRYWRREVRPCRSALLNPLSAQEIAANLIRMNVEGNTCTDYSRLEVEEDDEDQKPPGSGFM